MTRTDQQIYKVVADVVSKSAPVGWREIIVAASISDDNGEAIYDYVDESGKRQWFAPDTSSQYEVYTAFQELHSLMRASGNSWGKARFTLERSGKFRTEFDYES